MGHGRWRAATTPAMASYGYSNKMWGDYGEVLSVLDPALETEPLRG